MDDDLTLPAFLNRKNWVDGKPPGWKPPVSGTNTGPSLIDVMIEQARQEEAERKARWDRLNKRGRATTIVEM